MGAQIVKLWSLKMYTVEKWEDYDLFLAKYL